jgi:hypothetical protein
MPRKRRETLVNASEGKRVLVVAHRTAATPRLIEAVKKRAAEGPSSFVLLVPELAEAHQAGEAELVVSLATPLLEGAAGGRVEGVIGPNDPYRAIRELHEKNHFDEIIISTLSDAVSHWLRRDLPARVRKLGVPVTVVKAMAGDPLRSGGGHEWLRT